MKVGSEEEEEEVCLEEEEEKEVQRRSGYQDGQGINMLYPM